MRNVSTSMVALAACLAAHGLVRAQGAEPEPTTAETPVLVAPSLRPEAHMHPPYPPDADGQPARVLLQITIDAEGSVAEAEVITVDREGDQASQLAELALRYVHDLSFEPATKDGVPVPATIRFEVLFDPPDHSHPQDSEITEGQPDVRREPGFSATAVVAPSDISASSIDLTGEEIRLRPYLSTGDLLNAAPGFYAIQHAGGGKANQYFLRGFDADHGTDVAFFVDGVPLNWVSHGHGQGYTDLHFIIPELIQRMEVRKGPYFAEYGDFATAGAINLVLENESPTSSLTVGGGMYRTFRGVAIVSPKLSKVKPLLAAEVFGSDGPFQNAEDLLRVNVFARTTFDLRGETRLAVTGMAYLNDWNASGQIPLRAVDNTLQSAPAREITTTQVDANIGEGGLGLFGEEELAWKWLRLIGGLRFEYFGFNVTDRLEDRSTPGTVTSGEESQAIVLPKASLIVRPVEPLELFVNFGRGFHSNDARGVVLRADPVTPLAAALGWELGARVIAWERFQLSTTFFWLNLDSEVVWIGDEGTTEASGQTQRLGLEAQFRLEILSWLLADLDATWVRAEFVNNPGNANAVALAPELLISGGLSARDPRTGLSGRLGVFYIADRPATEDRFLTAEGFVRVDASFGWENHRFGVKAQVLNLINTRWRQAQFATIGRLPGEDSPEDCPSGTRPITEPDGTFVGCEDLHFTPGWPIFLQVLGTVKFWSSSRDGLFQPSIEGTEALPGLA